MEEARTPEIRQKRCDSQIALTAAVALLSIWATVLTVMLFQNGSNHSIRLSNNGQVHSLDRSVVGDSSGGGSSQQIVESDLISRLAALEELSAGLNESFASLADSLLDRLPEACETSCQHGSLMKDCTCQCQTGWTGESCSVPLSCAASCEVDASKCDCQHGGDFDSESCSCACLAGWTGQQCQVEDTSASSADISASLSERLARLLMQPQLQQPSSAPFASLSAPDSESDPLQGVTFTQLTSTIGTSVQSFSRKMMGVQLLSFTYNHEDASKWWLKPSGKSKGSVAVAPNEVEMTLIPGSPVSPLIDSDVYQSLNDFVQDILSQRSELAAPAPAIVTQLGFANLAGELFAGSNQLYSRTTARYPYYRLKLPTNTAAHALRYSINADFLSLLLSLPAYSTTSQSYYFQVLDALGDSVIVEVEEGGYLEQWSTLSQAHADGFANADAATIAKWAQNQMHSNVGQDADDCRAFDSLVTASAVYCTGGASGDSFGCDYEQLAELIASFPDEPRPTAFRTVPISQIIPNLYPAWQLWWQQAQNDWYVQRSSVYTGASSCPPCQNGGSCSAGNIYCVCPPLYAGRTCADFIGKPNPANASVSVDNPIQTTKHEEGTTQSKACPPGTAVTMVQANWAGTCHSSCNDDGHVLRNLIFYCTPIQQIGGS